MWLVFHWSQVEKYQCQHVFRKFIFLFNCTYQYISIRNILWHEGIVFIYIPIWTLLQSWFDISYLFLDGCLLGSPTSSLTPFFNVDLPYDGNPFAILRGHNIITQNRSKKDLYPKFPSRELTYPFPAGTFQDDLPFPKVGYVFSFPGGYGFVQPFYWVDVFVLFKREALGLPRKPQEKDWWLKVGDWVAKIDGLAGWW